ncbi:hypothetical protein EMIHUDRAFT_224340 [Emiliania huxleyi CCMP1516]|uniref:Uncharacterized protein n=2 Tax=Emiliania huxleyi TaxID=2903 RepID=A0A0D3KS42_EMIH1|nr:hypothetical protein EMIHUDRAFT_224340 [Emiliania huxleyi CCMP1516]EOD38577.1 hypothetical protein EMIHUDRAFT_224340 [Emiliania huxleyi CCMP1516]|eukprot:XP_005791006.1 hypothetical protein EMIHUDRAFT_224340 [Emiliania huxleyi CCMP1516]
MVVTEVCMPEVRPTGGKGNNTLKISFSGGPFSPSTEGGLRSLHAEKRAKGKKGKKKKKGGGSGGAGPSQESEAPAEAAAAKPAPLDKEGLLKLLAELHEDRIRFGITPETSGQGAGGGLARAQGQLAQW